MYAEQVNQQGSTEAVRVFNSYMIGFLPSKESFKDSADNENTLFIYRVPQIEAEIIRPAQAVSSIKYLYGNSLLPKEIAQYCQSSRLLITITEFAAERIEISQRLKRALEQRQERGNERQEIQDKIHKLQEQIRIFTEQSQYLRRMAHYLQELPIRGRHNQQLISIINSRLIRFLNQQQRRQPNARVLTP